MSISDAVEVVQTIPLGHFIALLALCAAGVMNPRGLFLAAGVILLIVRFI